MNLTLTVMEKVSPWEGKGIEEGIVLQVCSVSVTQLRVTCGWGKVGGCGTAVAPG